MPHCHHAFVRIDRRHLLHNLAEIRKKTGGSKVMAVVKKNAYGHGLVGVAEALDGVADYFGVIYPEEGHSLRQAGIEAPILVLGATLSEDLSELVRSRLEMVALSVEHLRALDLAAMEADRTAGVHLKIDTGMGRIGTRWQDAESLIRAAARAPNIEILGVMTHLACADGPDDPFNAVQVERFEEVLALFPKLGLEVPPRHMAASGGILHYPDTHYDLVRPGHLLYGVYPDAASERSMDLQPVMSLHARVVFSKRVRQGDTLGYGNQWVADRQTFIATVPVGYGDGFPRQLTGKGATVLARGVPFPIAGSVMMDQLMIDTGDIELSPGDPVVLIGQQSGASISADDLARLLGTVPDDLLSGISPEIPRIIE